MSQSCFPKSAKSPHCFSTKRKPKYIIMFERLHFKNCFLFLSVNYTSPWSYLRNIVIKISLTNANNIFQHILTAFLKVVSLNIPLTFLHFLNVTILMKVFWTWSTSAKRMRQKENVRNRLLLNLFTILQKWTIIQRTFGHGPKDLYAKWSKGPSSGYFCAAATETLLLT